MPFFLFTRDEPTIEEVEYVVEADTPDAATVKLNDGDYKSRDVVDTNAGDGKITGGPTPCDANGALAEDDDSYVPPAEDDNREGMVTLLDEKRREVARRMTTARLDDAANCTSTRAEILSLVWNGGKGVSEWTEEECDEYLTERDEDGEVIDDDSPPEGE